MMVQQSRDVSPARAGTYHRRSIGGDPPAPTRSFVVLCDDPDAPAGTWHHWAAYDIPAGRTGLPEDAARHNGKEGFMQALNDFGRSGYGGPCPPRSHGPHH